MTTSNGNEARTVPIYAGHQLTGLHRNFVIFVQYHGHESVLEFVGEQLQLHQHIWLVVERQQSRDTLESNVGNLKDQLCVIYHLHDNRIMYKSTSKESSNS